MATELRRERRNTITSPKRKRDPHRELIALRINEGMSREQLALRIGVSRDTIRLGEDGFVPGPRIQFVWAQEFGKRPLDIWPIEKQRGIARSPQKAAR